MKEIDMYVRGICNCMSEDREGKFVVLLEYGRHQKIIKGKEYNTISANRMLIKAMIEGVKLLHEPCLINIYTPTKVGFNSKKSPNRFMIDTFKNLCVEGGHEFIEVVSRNRQNELIMILKTLG